MNGVCALLALVFVLAVIGQPDTKFRTPDHTAVGQQAGGAR